MKSATARLVKSSDVPLSQYTEEDRRIFESPSIENHLANIRRALALAAVLHHASVQIADECGLGDDLNDEASQIAADLCAEAWSQVCELQDVLPGRIANIHIVKEGGAR